MFLLPSLAEVVSGVSVLASAYPATQIFFAGIEMLVLGALCTVVLLVDVAEYYSREAEVDEGKPSISQLLRVKS
jgi:hypothetical protein